MKDESIGVANEVYDPRVVGLANVIDTHYAERVHPGMTEAQIACWNLKQEKSRVAQLVEDTIAGRRADDDVAAQMIWGVQEKRFLQLCKRYALNFPHQSDR